MPSAIDHTRGHEHGRERRTERRADERARNRGIASARVRAGDRSVTMTAAITA